MNDEQQSSGDELEALPRVDDRTLDHLRRIGQKTGRNPLGELGGEFLTRVPVLLEQIRTHLETGDSEQLRKSAHTLAGMAGSLGALRLSALSRRLESAARATRSTEWPSRFEAVLEEAELMEKEMRQVVDASGQPPDAA